MMIINFYNINYDLFLTTRFLFENMQDYSIGFNDYDILDITPSGDIFYVLAIIFSFLNVICLIYSKYIKEEMKNPNIEIDNGNEIKKELEFSQIVQKYLCFICNLIRKKFRPPNFFEAISIILILN